MHLRKQRWPLALIVGAGLLCVVILISNEFSPGPAIDFDYVPLSSAKYLSDITEPITIVDAISWDDGGSIGIEFADARGNRKQVLVRDDLWDRQNVVFATSVPSFEPGRRGEMVIEGGLQERAFLALLMRWRKADPLAIKTADRMKKWETSGKTGGFLTGFESPAVRGAAQTLVVIRRLRARYGLPGDD